MRIAFGIIDPTTRWAVDSGTLSATATTKFRRAAFAGDPASLDLPRRERDLFERGRTEAERALVDQTVEELAPRLSSAVFERLLRRID